MKKDILKIEVDEVGLALVPEDDSQLGRLWVAHLVNLKDHDLINVLICVEGRGPIAGEQRRSSTLRYLLDCVPALGSAQIEVLLPEVISLDNQFWLSFSHNNYLYEKKILVPAGAVNSQLLALPVLHTDGLWFE